MILSEVFWIRWQAALPGDPDCFNQSPGPIAVVRAILFFFIILKIASIFTSQTQNMAEHTIAVTAPTRKVTSGYPYPQTNGIQSESGRELLLSIAILSPIRNEADQYNKMKRMTAEALPF